MYRDPTEGSVEKEELDEPASAMGFDPGTENKSKNASSEGARCRRRSRERRMAGGAGCGRGSLWSIGVGDSNSALRQSRESWKTQKKKSGKLP